MPVPSSIADLSTTPASNSPAGSESPNTADDYLRTYAAFIKQTNDALPSATNKLPTANLADAAVTTVKIADAAVTPAKIAGTGDFAFPNLSYTGTLTGGTEVVNLGSGQLVKDASGNLGIGVTPSAWGATYKALQMQGSSQWSGANFANYDQNSYFNGTNDIYVAAQAASRYAQASGAHAWYTAPSGTAGSAITFTQAMTLDASGNLLVGTTTQRAAAKVGIDINPAVNSGIVFFPTTNAAYDSLKFYNNSSTQVGYVQSTTTATSYVTSSDYRLKDNIAPMAGALAKVALLKPCTYKWKVDGSDGQGFIAHELDEVVPGCVTGEKDATDADGKPQYQGIDTSFLVATLAAAIQELKALVDTQAARITALEQA